MYPNDHPHQGNTPVPITSLDLKLASGSWAFADAERTRIKEHWRTLADEKPRIWNGDVLICSSVGIENSVLSGQFIKTDYASFVAWRDWGWPDKTVSNCFGSAAVLTSDGALLYGRMGSHTLNSGKLYPPGGSLEMRDVRPDGQVDVIGSLTRELEEETGLKASDAEKGELLAIFDGPRLSVAKVFRFAARAEVLADQVRRYLPSAHEDELSDIEIVRSTSQFDSTMPAYAIALARYLVSRS
jgi:8-oxo-dGTP pyrophosphatase MutT (NUDIX family)